MATLELSNVRQRYGRQTVVDGVSLTLTSGAIACLLGPSGCGKTTLLRCIAGFEPLTEGEVRINGEVLASPCFSLPPERRAVGMVFQDYALFPHLTVAANIAFGLRRQATALRQGRVDELLETVGLTGLGRKYPHELSGGQQQRIALARALAPRPRLLLLDEPFSNLDVDLRERLSQEVREILRREGMTALLVTHDQHEAFAMADEIGVMQAGRIQQWDSAYNLYHRPANRFVADFIGQGAFLPARALDAQHLETALGCIRSNKPLNSARQAALDVLLRPDDVVWDETSPLRAEITQRAFRGAEILYTLRLASGVELLSLLPSHQDHAIGERIGVRLDVNHVVAFAASAD
ncbi:MAG: ABC transporter ATP-binding protein [Sterolibacterium sp.]|nr:ABC transporter ATP-binding protein [Sterolibacterium sp.]